MRKMLSTLPREAWLVSDKPECHSSWPCCLLLSSTCKATRGAHTLWFNIYFVGLSISFLTFPLQYERLLASHPGAPGQWAHGSTRTVPECLLYLPSLIARGRAQEGIKPFSFFMHPGRALTCGSFLVTFGKWWTKSFCFWIRPIFSNHS